MKAILCLDFDGVICDSLNETLLTAYNSYQIFNNQKDKTVGDLENIPKKISESFLKFRYLVREPGEFWILMNLFHSGVYEFSQEKFNEISASYNKTIADFEKIFFETRNEFKESYPEKWFALNKLYPQFIEGWSEIKDKFEVYVVTTKNLTAVTNLLEKFNIFIPKERLFTREKAKSKKEAIELIIKNQNISPENIIFIDDHPLHLKDIKETGIQCLWASWGYTKEDNYKETKGLKKINNLKEL